MDPTTVLLIVCCSSLLLPIPGVHATTTPPPSTPQNSTDNTTMSSTSTPTPSTTTTPSSGGCDDGDSGVGRGIGIGIGIMLCILAVVVALLVLWLWRRGWALPCNTDFASKHIGQGDTSGSVVHVKTQKTYGRQKEDNNQQSDGKGAATAGNYSSFHTKDEKPSYEALQRNLSQKSDVYEDPERSEAAKRPDSGRPTSDTYEDPEKPPGDQRVSENYEEPVALVNTGSAGLSSRQPPDGKRQSQAEDDEPGEIYENTDTPPPPRPSKGKGGNSDRRSSDKQGAKGAPGPPPDDNDDLYIDMTGGDRADSIYMNTD